MSIDFRIGLGSNQATLTLDNVEMSIEPIWEYRADLYWSNFEGIEEEMPMCYTETVNTLVDTSTNETKYASGSNLIYFNMPLTDDPNLGTNRRRKFIQFPYTVTTGPGTQVAGYTDLSYGANTGHRERIFIDNNSTFYTAGNNLANEGVFPCRVKIKLNLFSSNNNSVNLSRDYIAALMGDLVSENISVSSQISTVNLSMMSPISTNSVYWDLNHIFNAQTGPYGSPEYPENTDPNNLESPGVFVNSNFFKDHAFLIEDSVYDDFDFEDYRDDVKSHLQDFAKTNAIFVRIQKLDENGDEVRSYYIVPNEDGLVQFNDTQVVPLKVYTYKIYTYHLVDAGFKKGIIELLRSTNSVRLMQPPQNRPFVEFKNNSNSNDKINIMLNLSTNRDRYPYQALSDDEQVSFLEDYYLLNPYDLRYSFSQYETELGEFEIYKMKKQPMSYYNIKEISEEVRVEVGSSTLAYIEDSITPFVDYYYVFRSINTDGYYSNPSPIYKVHKTLDADESFLHVETVGFKDTEVNKYMNSKTMSKFLQILPSSTQVLTGSAFGIIDQNGGFDVANPEIPDLGLQSPSIWDQQKLFKVRLTSKKTGKKIDLNLRFKLQKQQIS